ncbi:hypothetical protein OJAV_G00183840 [Oryzias javanicus]|uniref:Uncharacterized protein n=1 Tax=Oryzias javanicus TaxID=123683 RepID=A0A437CEN6_ORYJA|nr:hypothetical protein OJAV_G00183840 [Oryzias javanicus]
MSLSSSTLYHSSVRCVIVTVGLTPPPVNTTSAPTQSVIVTEQTTFETVQASHVAPSPTDTSTVTTHLTTTTPAGNTSPPPVNITSDPIQSITVTKQTTAPTHESTVSTQLIPAGKNFVVALSIGISTNLPWEDIKDEFLSLLKAEFEVRRSKPILLLSSHKLRRGRWNSTKKMAFMGKTDQSF